VSSPSSSEPLDNDDALVPIREEPAEVLLFFVSQTPISHFLNRFIPDREKETKPSQDRRPVEASHQQHKGSEEACAVVSRNGFLSFFFFSFFFLFLSPNNILCPRAAQNHRPNFEDHWK
jgi:hypothetical protein